MNEIIVAIKGNQDALHCLMELLEAHKLGEMSYSVSVFGHFFFKTELTPEQLGEEIKKLQAEFKKKLTKSIQIDLFEPEGYELNWFTDYGDPKYSSTMTISVGK